MHHKNMLKFVTCPHVLGLNSAGNLCSIARSSRMPRTCPYCRRWDSFEATSCRVCRTALRFVELAESSSCGPSEHQWLAKELAKLLGEACTRLLLAPSSSQEGRDRSPLIRRSVAKRPLSPSQEADGARERSPRGGGASSGHRGDIDCPRGDSPPARQERWRPSLRARQEGARVISAARAGVSRDYPSRSSRAKEQKAGVEVNRSRIELKGAASPDDQRADVSGTPRVQEAPRSPKSAIPRTPPLPPLSRHQQEAKGKGRGKGKAKGKGAEQASQRKKKNKGLKRGPWWQGYLERRAARQSAPEAPAAEHIETEAEIAVTERIARWSDAPEEAGD